MKQILVQITIICSIALALLSGCAQAPEKDIAAAGAAVAETKAFEADRYAPYAYRALQDSLNAAIAEIEKQKSGFALTRNFEKAQKSIAAINALAASVKAEAATKKEAMKTAADTAMAQANRIVLEAKELLKKASKGKEGNPPAFAAYANEIAVVETTLTQASLIKGGGDYLGAVDKAGAGLQKVITVKNELQAAIDKAKGKRR